MEVRELKFPKYFFQCKKYIGKIGQHFNAPGAIIRLCPKIKTGLSPIKLYNPNTKNKTQKRVRVSGSVHAAHPRERKYAKT